MLKAFSDTFSVPVFPTVGELELSNSNLIPFSCKIENWSSVGNRFDSSSFVFATASESSAAKGSPSVTRIGEGLGFVAWLGCGVAAGSLPLRIGAISGSVAFSWCDGGENTAPTTGVEDFEAAGRGASRVCDWDLPEYICEYSVNWNKPAC